MLDPISKAIADIKMSIPAQVLQQAFQKETFGVTRIYERASPVSIDEMIKSKVIRKRVLVDCDLLGGRQVLLPLRLADYFSENTYATVYTFPPEATGGREIVSVLSVNYLNNGSVAGALGAGYAMANMQSTSPLAVAGERIMDSVASIPVVSTAMAELVGYNTVIVSDPNGSTGTYGIRCTLANDENLSNINPRSYLTISKACTLAVKSFIYNQLFIAMDRGALEQGQGLGSFKEAVDRYADAEEMYQDFLRNELQKVLFMNDQKRYGRFMKLQLNPGL